MNGKRLIRFKPMAKELAVSERTLHMLLEAGCPHIQRGRLIWLDPERVYQWLSQFERGQTTEAKKEVLL
jgi:hypothetical protein